MRRRLLLALLGVPTAARGQDSGPGGGESAAQARLAVEHGEIKPLQGILDAIEARYEGRVIATELMRREGRWVYRFKLLPPSGRLVRLCVDAASGAVLSEEGAAEAKP